MVSKGYLIAGIGAVAGLLGFFLPWVSLGQEGQGSGWNATFGYNFTFGGYRGNILMVVALLFPFVVGYLLYSSFKKGGALVKRRDGFLLIILGVALVLALVIYSGSASKLGASLGFGWILCLVSGLAIGVAGYLNLRQLQTGKPPF